ARTAPSDTMRCTPQRTATSRSRVAYVRHRSWGSTPRKRRSPAPPAGGCQVQNAIRGQRMVRSPSAVRRTTGRIVVKSTNASGSSWRAAWPRAGGRGSAAHPSPHPRHRPSPHTPPPPRECWRGARREIRCHPYASSLWESVTPRAALFQWHKTPLPRRTRQRGMMRDEHSTHGWWQISSFVPARDAEEYPSHSPLVDFVVLRYTRHRAVTTSPHTRVEVAVLGRLDRFLTTREPPSCFAGAPTSVWHRSRPSPCFSQRVPRGSDKQVMLCPSVLL